MALDLRRVFSSTPLPPICIHSRLAKILQKFPHWSSQFPQSFLLNFSSNCCNFSLNFLKLSVIILFKIFLKIFPLKNFIKFFFNFPDFSNFFCNMYPQLGLLPTFQNQARHASSQFICHFVQFICHFLQFICHFSWSKNFEFLLFKTNFLNIQIALKVKKKLFSLFKKDFLKLVFFKNYFQFCAGAVKRYWRWNSKNRLRIFSTIFFLNLCPRFKNRK